MSENSMVDDRIKRMARLVSAGIIQLLIRLAHSHREFHYSSGMFCQPIRDSCLSSPATPFGDQLIFGCDPYDSLTFSISVASSNFKESDFRFFYF